MSEECQSTGPGFDAEELLDRVGGDREFLGELVELFVGSYPEHLAAIRRAMLQCDAAALERSAHSLKGSVANFAAPRAVDAALQLELVAAGGDLAGAGEALDELETTLARLETALVAFCAAEASS
jgi:two-component system, sensor histidine kinase and response regulator